MKLSVIDTELFKLDGGAMFGVVPKTIWSKQYPADGNNLCTLAMRCLLVEDGNRLVLIDCGMGNKHSAKFLSYYFLHGNHSLEASIHQAGYHTNDITDIIFTHLHFDHCGGAVKKNNNQFVLTFPNATYWTNEQQWNSAMTPNPREQKSFFPENYMLIKDANKLKFIPIDSETFFTPNISIKFFNGHTHALMVPHIHYHRHQIIYVTDVIPSIGHIPIAYIPAYDIQPLISMQEKQQLLTAAYANNAILFFEHDPYTQCCTITSTDKGYSVDKTFPLSSII